MKTIKLEQVEHNIKIGKECPYYEPNIKEDCLLELDGEVVGFYIKDVGKYSKKLNLLLAVANKEFRSTNVPKTKLDRSDVLKIQQENPGMTRSEARALGTSQMSVILGSIPPKPQFKRPYPSISTVHRNEKSQIFIKAMWGACIEAEQIVKKITPEIYERQQELLADVKDEWKFGTMYTSSISNYNISAPFHRDTGNIVGTVNIILTKRNNSKGGCLNVPDYNVTFEQTNNSMLVYPAWKNVHGVTPIIPTAKDGYRNSLIFYPLKAFKGI
mgnify:CR=1 FL=1|jgi:hypothetical protein|tara:strand:+ start:745 stop:1557 length:813 start_codon:yes stop_codon:yes gene_type:complete